MSLTRLLAVARKELLHILRDYAQPRHRRHHASRADACSSVTESISISRRFRFYVYDQDGSQQSQDLLKRFQASEYFHIVGAVDNNAAIARALDSGEARMGFVIPWDFSRRLSRGGSVNVQALVDATDNNTANVLMGYTQAVVQGYSADVQLDWLQVARTIDSAHAAERTNPHLVQRGS